MLVELPRWLAEMPPGEEKNRALQTFILRRAILYSHPIARAKHFAGMIGVHHETFKSQLNAMVRASKKTKEGIRRVLGPEFVPPDMPPWPRYK